MGEYLHNDDQKQQGHKHESKPQQRKKDKERDSSAQNQWGQDAVGGSSNGTSGVSNGVVDLSHLSDDERSRYLMNLMQGSTAGSRESELDMLP